MYKVEIKDLGENNASLSKIIKHINYRELYELVKPYIKEEHLSFSLPNDCTDGREWGNIYSKDKVVGEILITFIEQ